MRLQQACMPTCRHGRNPCLCPAVFDNSYHHGCNSLRVRVSVKLSSVQCDHCGPIFSKCDHNYYHGCRSLRARVSVKLSFVQCDHGGPIFSNCGRNYHRGSSSLRVGVGGKRSFVHCDHYGAGARCHPILPSCDHSYCSSNYSFRVRMSRKLTVAVHIFPGGGKLENNRATGETKCLA